jgi:TrmH family RNA methyltransferase
MSAPLSSEFLLRLRAREPRDEHGLFLAEGVRFLHDAIASGADIRGLVVCPAVLASSARSLLRRGVPIRTVDEDELRALSIRSEPDGVVCVVAQRWRSLGPPGRRDVWLLLDHVRSPGNLGTLLRTARATGARGVIFLGESADPHDPRTVRASMGAIFHLALVRASSEELCAWSRRHGVRVLGTSADAVVDYRSVSYERIVLMLGSERKGLTPRQRSLCDAVVSIPMDAGDSLNLGVAGSLLLYEAYRHRTPPRCDRPLRRAVDDRRNVAHHPRRK